MVCFVLFLAVRDDRPLGRLGVDSGLLQRTTRRSAFGFGCVAG